MAKKRPITQHKTYKIGDFVLAKMRGWPEWPAKVIEVRGPGKYIVKFYQSEEISTTAITLKPYDDTIQYVGKTEPLREAHRKCRQDYERSYGISTKEQAKPIDKLKEKLKEKSQDTTDEIKTLEKLRKKLQEKLDEKEDKKRSRIERKLFEKASNKLQQKFIAKFKSMTQIGEQFVNNPQNQRNAMQLTTSMKNCEKSLDLLVKCVDPLLSDYGRSQKESWEFHKVFGKMVTCLKGVKDVKDISAKPISKEAKRLIKEMKARQSIKTFINKFEELAIETKEEFVVERKENARKRMRSAH